MLPEAQQQADRLFGQIGSLIEQARTQVHRAVNSAMVSCYWQIGCLIVESEQQGQTRAAYGQQLLAQLAVQLTSRFGKGFDASNLRNMRRFYLAFPIQETVSLELSWSHYNLLSRIDNPAARQWYPASLPAPCLSTSTSPRSREEPRINHPLLAAEGVFYSVNWITYTVNMVLGHEGHPGHPDLMWGHLR